MKTIDNFSMKIIPAIDIMDGKCVRLRQGDFAQKTVYSDDPIEMARSFEAHGLSYLHVVDLDGARNGRICNADVLARIAAATDLKIDFGGGIRTDSDLQLALDSGAQQVNLGSIAVREPETVMRWLGRYGGDRLLLGADCRQRQIMVDGWQSSAAMDLLAHIRRFIPYGLQTVVCTDIARDGMLTGPSTALYKELIAETGLNIIASGGVSSLADLAELQAAGCRGAILGKALYENRISLPDLQQFSVPC
ncbi:MAG: 1-(5-phosphoribosyl)-5-[(5-phosphoribosylamino)methylideneamino]imidazole-4-carboxamide isomerase [Bacteroidota bacterium]